MQDLTRRTFRTWTVAEALYAAALIVVIAVFVPWKTPWLNAVGLAYGVVHLASAVGLGLRRRWGWRLALAAGLVGLLGCVAVTSALVASWAYLRGVYNDFGEGASLGALIVASGVLQVLGLYPALKLVALLRKEVRQDMRGGGAVKAAAVGMLLLPLFAGMAGGGVGTFDPPEPVSQEGRQQALDVLEAAMRGAPLPASPALVGLPVGPLPLYVTLWVAGEAKARVLGQGADLDAAVRDAASRLPAEAGRVQVHRVVGVGAVPFEAWDPALSLSVNPGVDGVVKDDPEAALLPEDLVKLQVFGKTALVPSIRELRLGMDAAQVRERLGGQGAIRRLRTESWVAFEGEALPVTRVNVPLAEPDRARAYEAAAVAAGEYMARQLRTDGRYGYRFYPLSGKQGPFPRTYSVARHAGTAFGLAVLAQETGSPAFAEASRRGVEHLQKYLQADCPAPGAVCLVLKDKVELGNNALAAVAMLAYQRATGDTTFEAQVRGLVAFLASMQREDGSFDHLMDPASFAVDASVLDMFASEEAALALVLAHEVLGDEAVLERARRALDHLTGPKYDTFWLGNFIYGADVWTCMAADEAYPRLQADAYVDFCLGYARFVRRVQYQPGEWDNADFAGHYGFGALMVPQAPGAAGFTEAVVSACVLARRHGRPAEDVCEQAALGLDALARDQVRNANAWMMPSPARARGGIRRSLVEQMVRIDFPQHAAGALIRGARMVSAGAG